MNMAALNVPTTPPAAATPAAPPAPAVSMTPPAAAQPVVYDPPPAEPAASAAEPAADVSDSVAPVRRSRPAPAPAPAARKASASSANATKARYTIKKGDSLWSIAEAKYGDGHKWKRIAAANPKLNPNRVQAGQTITLP
jgi:5'-nucleotidase